MSFERGLILQINNTNMELIMSLNFPSSLSTLSGSHLSRRPENGAVAPSLSSAGVLVVLGIIAMIACGAAGLHGHLSLSTGGAAALVSVGSVLATALILIALGIKSLSQLSEGLGRR